MTNYNVQFTTQDVIELLRRIPERWEPLDRDSLTAIEAHVLQRLIAAGMVEKRGRLSVGFAGHIEHREFEFIATGENGFVQALSALISDMWARFSEEYEEWKRGPAAEQSPFHVTLSQGSEAWRLTTCGILARDESRDPIAAMNAAAFVARIGPYLLREPVPGAGSGHFVRDASPSGSRSPSRVVVESLPADFQEMVKNAISEAVPPEGSTFGKSVHKPDGWTQHELLEQAGTRAEMSDTTFARIRVAAKVKPSPSGGAGATRRYSQSELRKLISAVKAGTFRNRIEVAAAWSELLDDPSCID